MPKDFLMDTDGDMLIVDGDIAVGDSTLQNQYLLLKLQPGELRQWPQTGVGLENYLDDDDLGELEAEIRAQFVADGMTVNICKIFEDGKIEIDASYDDANA